MIKKLQRKFIMITMGSLALVVFILLGSINVVNLYQIDRKVNGALKILSENQGKFPIYKKGKLPPNEQRFGFQMNAETQFETRYFVVKVNKDGSIREIDTSHIAAVSSTDAAGYANKVLGEGKTSGYNDIYKYVVVNDSVGLMLVFMDCRSQIQIATLFLLTSCGVALITLLLVFILVSIFSKKAINPIIENMEKQKQFITDAGHEIKTPLAIISANADVLELTHGKNEWITSTRNQITRLDKLVKNLLTLSKMDEGNIKLVFTDFDLSDAVFETTAPFGTIAETQHKKFLMDIKPGIKLHGDEDSIHQLVSTLVDNAVKYSNEKGTIKISLSAAKKGSKLEIYNTTDEIDKENLDKLFDRFYRADSSRSRETGGYGIGLSIAKSIVQAHHGKISVRSEDGKSICFTVLI
ncbi:GHKL domain-containing protein [Clostridium autoethanogenum]|uniref:histidine kinase n=2 Tax=Clostridium TaxID=1485 RepID=A0A1A6AVV2_9CLOT|nr:MULTISPECIES: HAMP domain-containing sensor histidine kinase [Clostridium]OBR94216.1 alkaline phosphatase synthesis sensor protein PhoR [Clostridium ragsdalei P11]RMD01053.1 GHKL domain-containing protein [Clostridium autoethanogenum]